LFRLQAVSATGRAIPCIGHGNTGVLVSHLPNREAAPVSGVILEILRACKAQCLTLTFDKGKEFADHVFFGNCLGTEVFFGHPYHSWERGSNENTNGLLRQFFAKRMGFANLCPTDIEDAAYKLKEPLHNSLRWVISRTRAVSAWFFVAFVALDLVIQTQFFKPPEYALGPGIVQVVDNHHDRLLTCRKRQCAGWRHGDAATPKMNQ
jgi:hypothetical protein